MGSIQKEIEGRARLRVRFQTCRIAIHHTAASPGRLIAPIMSTQNGFISAVGNQEKARPWGP